MERLQNAARRGACLAVILSLVAQAAASDSWWNPFDNSSSDADQRRPSTAQVSSSKPKSSTSGFPKLPMPSLPKWSLSGSDTDRRSAPKEPSTWDKLNSGTKSFFSKTADFLTPWDNDPEPPPRSRGVNGVTQGGVQQVEPQTTREESRFRGSPEKKRNRKSSRLTTS